MRDWLRMLSQNHFRIHPLRLVLAGGVTLCTPFNSVMGTLQDLIYGRRIHSTPIDEPPIFIVGHWRSGTTHLHELLVRDSRFAYPTTYECFAPKHFLLTSWCIPTLLGFLLPRKRPMDNMSAGFRHPQEDEFALMNLGCPTTYWRMAFPNEPPQNMELLDMQDVPADKLERWKHDMQWIVQALTFKKRKPLVLKSPPHTGRLAILNELFPGARFIHMTRDPETLFVSTRRLWPSLDSAQGLQIPRNKQLDEFIFDCFARMYRGFESQRDQLEPHQICDVRYEDLVRDPIDQLQRIYDHLQLGAFENVRPDLEAYVGQQKDYQPNKHPELEPEIKDQLQRRWADYYQKYGYSGTADAVSSQLADSA